MFKSAGTLLLGMAVASCHAPGSDLSGGAPSAPPGNSRVVEVACGECQFGLPGDGCDLAVRFDGAAHFVSGTGIDDHGDAHAADGFCNAIRRAEVVGRMEGDRFAVTSMKLLPPG